MTIALEQVVDMDKLANHVKLGMVSVTKHPHLPLRIYNYTQRAQRVPGIWGDGTIDWCRGLIVDERNNIVARPFKKFHNLNTPTIPETLEANLPKVMPTITEKMDGSLGILWEWDGYTGIATRGSFTSPQALWASSWYQRHCFVYKNENDSPVQWPEGCTPLFEIIYKANRIVCNYEQERLVLLGLISNASGHELDYSSIAMVAEDSLVCHAGWSKPDTYHLEND